MREELERLEHAKLLETKLKVQRKAPKLTGRTASLAALKDVLSASGHDDGGEQAVQGLQSPAGLLEDPNRRRHGIWLRSKELSSKKPMSEKQLPQFEQRLKEHSMPSHPLPTEQMITLYNRCRAHIVLLLELESKNKRLEYEHSCLLKRTQQQLLSVGPLQHPEVNADGVGAQMSNKRPPR